MLPLSDTTQAMPPTVKPTATISTALSVSPRKAQAIMVLIIGTRDMSSMARRGPINTKAWKRKASPNTRPTTPDSPSQNQRSSPA
jgi:hypothetical protein